MICAARACTVCLRLRSPRPLSRNVSSAAVEESRSSVSSTGRRKRASSRRAKRRARRVMSCSRPSIASGRPTTSSSGRHSRTSVSTSAMHRLAPAASNIPRGLASRVSVSPTATPIQRAPKSKASTVWPETFDGATAASLARATALTDRFQNVLGSGETHLVAHRKSGLPLSERLVQDKTAVGLHRSAEIDRLIEQDLRSQPQAQALEQGSESHLDRTIDHYAERPLVIVLADERQGAGKIRIDHVGHGDQEMVGEIDLGHGGELLL